MTRLSISHEQNVFHAMLGHTIQKPLSLGQMGKLPLVLACNIRNIGLTKFVQMMILSKTECQVSASGPYGPLFRIKLVGQL